MDIEQLIHLRTFVRPSLFPFAKPIALALLIHSLIFIYWQPLEKLVVAETPNWINIKLISEIEEKKEKVPKKVKEKKNKNISKFNKPIIKKQIKKIKKTSEIKKKEENTHIEKRKATTFVKANSRPYRLENPKPVYPAAARRRGMHGVVVLSIVINERGRVDNIHVARSSGFKVLDRSALASVKQWRFMPASRGGLNVSSVIKMPIKFILDDLRLN